MTERAGGCQCGAVRYVAKGEPIVASICHCNSCRRAHAAPVVAWAMYPEGQVTFSGDAPRRYRSSEPAERHFCANCGTAVAFTATFLPGLIDLPVGSLDDPESVRPTFHFWHSKHLSWAELADDLPRHPELPDFGKA